MFITYTHPDDRSALPNRRRVARFIATHHRNRSAPSTKPQSTRFDSEKHPSKILAKQTITTRQPVVLPQAAMHDVHRDNLGFQQDPFAVLPTNTSPIINVALQYYIQSYAPTHLILPDKIAVGNRQHMVMHQVKNAIQRPFFFESVLALAFSDLAVMDLSFRNLAMHHYGRALSLLSVSLSEGNFENAVLSSILSIIGVNYLLNDLPALQTNLGGLRQVIERTGGLESVDELLRPAIVTVESFWTYLRHQAHLCLEDSLPAISLDTPNTEADKHSLQSKVPPGFEPLLQEQLLSSDVITVIVREAESSAMLTYAVPSSHLHADGTRKFANVRRSSGESVTLGTHIETCEILARLLVRPNATHLDLICCIGMFFNALCVTRNEQLSPIYFTQLQHHANQLLHCELDSYDVAARNLHAWAIFQVASTMLPINAETSHSANDLRLKLCVRVVRAFPGWSWSDMRLMLANFICSETCLDVFRHVWTAGRSQVKLD